MFIHGSPVLITVVDGGHGRAGDTPHTTTNGPNESVPMNCRSYHRRKDDDITPMQLSGSLVCHGGKRLELDYVFLLVGVGIDIDSDEK